MVSEEVTDAQLDLAYRLFKKYKNKFGSIGSPKVLEAIARFVNKSGGRLDMYSPRLSFKMIEDALKEDIDAHRWDMIKEGPFKGTII